MKNDDNYVYGIDGIRFMCAMLVAIFHLTYSHADGSRAVPFGWVGVQIFFVISGIVIANSANQSSPKKFLVGRFLRLYPGAWIAAAVTVAIFLVLPWSAFKQVGVNVIPQLGALARSLTLVGDYHLTSSYWTLPVELAFYALVFASLVARVSLLWVARLLVLIAAPYLVAAVLHHSGMTSAPSLEFGNDLTNALLIKHGPYFAIGIYIWVNIEKQRLALIDKAFAIAAIFLVVAELMIKSLSFANPIASGAEKFSSTATMAGYSFVTFAFFVLGIYGSMKYRDKLKLSYAGKISLRTIGLMTYPFYLLHESIGGAILHASGSKTPAVLPVLAAIVAAAAAAYVVSNIAEPWLRLQLKSRIPLLREPLPLSSSQSDRVVKVSA